LRWAREKGCAWGLSTCGGIPLLGAGTWRCWCWRGSKTARGACRLVKLPLRAGTWRCCSGRGSMAARGMRERVKPPLR